MRKEHELQVQMKNSIMLILCYEKKHHLLTGIRFNDDADLTPEYDVDDNQTLINTVVRQSQNFNSCESVICQEMQAYRETGECQRSDPGNVRSCVIEGAFLSSEGECQSLDPEDLRSKISAMYESCYASYGNPFT